MDCRLLYLVGQLGFGGLERQLVFLLQAMDRERYKPVVVVWRYCEKDPYVQEILALPVQVLCVGNDFSRLGKLMVFRHMVSQLQPEVVHSYSFHTNFATWFATRGSTAIPVGSIRNNFLIELRCTGIIRGRLCARWPVAQICNSVAAKVAVENSAGPFKPTQTLLVRNRLDIDRFKYHPLLPTQARLLAVGRLFPEKRWDRLIKVSAMVAARGVGFLLRHVGVGPLLSDLRAQVRVLGMDGLIEFLGPRNDVPALLADSTFLVHTAEDEGCPNVVMEAMACGRAVIAMDAGDIRFLVEDGKTGFVVRQGDETTFAERVLRLLADHELCRRMGLAARTKAEQEFGLGRLVSETLGAYKSAGWKD